MPYIGNQPYQGVIDSGNIVDGSIQTGDLANSAVTTAKIADSNITSAKIADTGVTVAKLNSDVTQLIAQGGGPKITGVAITNSSWTNLDDTAVDTAGGYIKLTGTNFVTGCSVVVGTTSATAVTFTSSTELRVQLPAQAAGTYILYVTNPDGGTAIRVNAVTYSATPSWVTSSTLPQQDDGVAISIQLSATSATTYALQAGSTLPSGLTLTSGGLLSGTVSGLANDTSYSFTVVATDAELQDSPRAFTVNIAASDTYFNLTTLLINGDTAPNVLTDASSNNFNLTAYGSTRASNFSPYGTGWSNYFDGSGDCLNIASNGVFSFGTGDFTIECWLYSTDSASDDGVIVVGDQAAQVGISSTGTTIKFRYNTGLDLIAKTNVTINQWHHVAITRNNGIGYLYIDGISAGSAALTTNFSQDKVIIGSWIGLPTTSYEFTGFISNVRIVKGLAVYTGNFTTPTQPLTLTQSSGTNISAITGTQTSLLTCHTNRFADGSANNLNITRTGDVAVRSFNPFNITNTGTSGSMYFDGDGDYIIGSSGGFLGSGDFTVEMWYYPTTSSFGRGGAQNWGCVLFDTRETGSADASGFLLGITNTGQGQLYLGGGTPGAVAATTNTMRHLEWNHIAAVRIGSTITVYINGIAGSTYTYSTNFLRNRVQISGPYDVLNSTYIMAEGYIADVRSISGTGVYTGNFSIPKLGLLQKSGSASAAVYSNTTNINTTFSDTNCQLLSLQYKQPHNNHGFQDSSTNSHLITRNGNATQGTFSPFSPVGWSGYFNGSDAYLSYTQAGSTYPSQLSFLNGASAIGTIECWVYPLSSSQGANLPEAPAILAVGDTYFSLNVTTTNKARFYWYYNAVPYNLDSTASVPFNAWTHIAAVRNGASVTLYINGVASGSTTYTGWTWGTAANGSQLKIGYHAPYSTARYFNGYISNLRIVNGTALYTANFTPDTSPLTPITNTSLLVFHTNRFVDSSASNTVFTVSGTPQVQAFSPFKPTAAYSPTTHGGSLYLDGTGDNLQIADTPNIRPGSGDFTYEFWWYPTSLAATYQEVVTKGVGLQIYTNLSTMYFGVSANNTGTYFINSSFGTLTANAWNHIVICRQANNYYAYLNGLKTTFSSSSSSPDTGTDIMYIGRYSSPEYPTIGYISNFRFVKGTAIYTAASIPTLPTSPVTATTDTQLLLNFTDAAARDSSGRLVLETVNDSKVSVVQKKYGTGAMYFDGTGDYVYTSRMTPLGSGDFTIELWCYTTVIGANTCIFDLSDSGTSGFMFRQNTNNSILVYNRNASTNILVTSNNSIATNVWQHIAVVRSAGTVTVYVNGVNVGSASNSINYTQTGLYLGAFIGEANAPYAYTGYIDDLRVTRYARYTGTSTSTPNFTPPAQTFKLR